MTHSVIKGSYENITNFTVSLYPEYQKASLKLHHYKTDAHLLLFFKCVNRDCHISRLQCAYGHTHTLSATLGPNFNDESSISRIADAVEENPTYHSARHRAGYGGLRHDDGIVHRLRHEESRGES